jgi:hypothetical protein
MEWIRTGHGHIPEGYRPVEGGYEANGARLYHAYARIDGVDVPGKTGTHLVSYSGLRFLIRAEVCSHRAVPTLLSVAGSMSFTMDTTSLCGALATTRGN